MKTFEIRVTEQHASIRIVLADNLNEAIQKCEDGDYDEVEIEYLGQEERKYWRVEELEETEE